MLKSYLSVAWRSMLRHGFTSAINIVGLAIGLMVCLIVYLFINYETSFDTMYKDHHRVYRIHNSYEIKNQNVEGETSKLAPPAAIVLRDGMPDLEEAVRIYAPAEKESQVSRNNKLFLEQHVYFSDPEIFNVFNFEFIEGSPTDALTKPFSVVLTQSMAKKYFELGAALGKTLTYRNQYELEVTGVIKDIPEQSHLAISMLVSIASVPAIIGTDALDAWSGGSSYTYIKVTEGANIESVGQRAHDLINTQGSVDSKYISQYYLMPLTDIHLYAKNYNEMAQNGDINNVYVFLVLSLIILIVISINFINLSTVRAMRRAKEVGVRKSIGALREQIVVQFLTESTLTAGIAALFSICLTFLVLPIVSELFGRPLDYTAILNWKPLLFLLIVTLFVGLLAGVYPAIFLSGFNPARVLKGDVTRGNAGNVFRKSLVSFQFSITVFLIVCTVFMSMQMYYVTKERVGYDITNKIMVRIPYSESGAYKALKNELLKHPEIKQVMGSSTIPTQAIGDTQTIYRLGDSVDGDNGVVVRFVGVQHGFFDFYKINILHGRAFSENLSTDLFAPPKEEEQTVPIAFIVNELTAIDLGYSPESIIGVQLKMGVGNGKMAQGSVVGVIRDTNFSSFKNDPVATMFYMDESENSRVSILTSGHDIPSVVEHIEKTWKQILPKEPVQIGFVEDMFDQIYKNEHQQVLFFNVLSGLSIFLSLLGLYGLTSYTAERRAKEIAVRKVLGASTSRVLLLLSSETTKLVIFSNAIAWPLGYVVVKAWLGSFVYRIDITLWVFIVSSLCAFLLAMLTLASQAFLVVRRPVVTSLKCD